MPDRGESIHSTAAPYDEDAGWRETYLAEIGDAQGRQALRELSRVLIGWARECSRPASSAAESPVAEAVRSASADLHHLAGHLAQLESWPTVSAVGSRAELELCALAGRQSRMLEAAARELLAALAARVDR